MRTWLGDALYYGVGVLVTLCIIVQLLKGHARQVDLARSTAATDQPENSEVAVEKAEEHPTVSAQPHDPAEEPKEITNTVGMRFVRIPKGTFLMGSPTNEKDRFDDETQHQVTVTMPFFMGRTEVTQGQWKKVMGTEPWKGNGHVQEGDDYPAVNFGWDNAVAFCKKLSAMEGKTYRLPTEAEWEYACRGGTKTAFSFGDDEGQLGLYAWYLGNAWAIDKKYAHKVGRKRANAFGLYDMHGNVYEWCIDWYGDYPSTPLTDPRGPNSGSFRVLRGGCYGSEPGGVRCAFRDYSSPGDRSSSGGFRLVLE